MSWEDDSRFVAASLDDIDDPNVAIVLFAGEIEQRLRALAETRGMNPQIPLKGILEGLVKEQVFPEDAADGLLAFVRNRRSIAHGAHISQRTLKRLQKEGPAILHALDSLIDGRAERLEPA